MDKDVMTSDENRNREKLLTEFKPATYEEWQREAEGTLDGKPIEKVFGKSYEGIDIKPIYRKEDAASPLLANKYPGFPPYIRGKNPDGYKNKGWNISQELPYPTSVEFNKAVKQDFEREHTVLNMVLDDASASGVDPDFAKVNEIFSNGTSISTMRGFKKLFENIEFNKVHVKINPGIAAIPIAAIFTAYMDKAGVPRENALGSIGYDPVGYLNKKGTLPFNLKKAYDEMALLVKWGEKNLPNMKTIAVSAVSYLEAGGNAVQELAFSLATAVEYIRAMLERGLDINQISGKMFFKFSIGPNFFMEIAKFRTLRLLWSKIVKEFGGDDEACKINILARTGMINKSKLDPYVNMLRNTCEALAGVFGGADDIHIEYFDRPHGLPKEFSRRNAFNTHIILKEECSFSEVVDPAGGSWYVESLTAQLAEKAWKLFQQIEKEGGMVNALMNGIPQAEIEKVARDRKKNLATRKDILVGVNKYPNGYDKSFEDDGYDLGEIFERRIEFLNKVRKERDNSALAATLKHVATEIAANSDKTIDLAVEAAKADATLGEIFDAIHTKKESVSIEPIIRIRLAEDFETIRRNSESYAAQNGFFPKVFLATMGPLKQHKPRADFSLDFFKVGGFDVIYPKGFDTPEEAAAVARESGANIIVICSTDDTYPVIVPALTAMIKKKDPAKKVILAGLPSPDLVDDYKSAGIDEFIHIKADIYSILSTLQRDLGI